MDNICLMLIIIALVLIYLINKSDNVMIPIYENFFDTQNCSLNPIINIRHFQFQPDYLIVPVNTEVTWINKSQNKHRISSALFQSPLLEIGQEFKFIFRHEGTYHYQCGQHGAMRGTIVVVDKGVWGGSKTHSRLPNIAEDPINISNSCS